MNEDVLHYLWQYQLFNHTQLSLTDGSPFSVIKPGILNKDAGPDFFNGQIKIGNTIWAGNIEIHYKASDWLKHGHDKDQVYDKVILHVVWDADYTISRTSNNESIPTLELKGLVKKSLLEKYESLKSSKSWIACEKELEHIDAVTKEKLIESRLFERLEQKVNRIEQLLILSKNDWEGTFFQLLAKYFGFKTNAIPFELLASSLSFSIFRKHWTSSKQMAALLFGQAGFLAKDYKGDYPRALREEYKFLKNKYKLSPIDIILWKFMRMRPASFPTIRIAQFIALYEKNNNLFQKLVEAKSIDDLKQLFDVTPNKYWDVHYRFDIPAAKKSKKRLGDGSINILLINVVVPILFSYGKKIGDDALVERAIGFLQELPSEKNNITKKWKERFMPLSSAYDSQALLQLKNNHCKPKKCLSCAIGNTILAKQ